MTQTRIRQPETLTSSQAVPIYSFTRACITPKSIVNIFYHVSSFLNKKNNEGQMRQS